MENSEHPKIFTNCTFDCSGTNGFNAESNSAFINCIFYGGKKPGGLGYFVDSIIMRIRGAFRKIAVG